MAIRIDKGTVPPLGRITLPQGTFLSSQAPFSQPSTAADGSLGTGGAMLPATPQVPLGPAAPGGIQPGIGGPQSFGELFSPTNPGRATQGGGSGPNSMQVDLNNFIDWWRRTMNPQNPGRNVVGGANYPDVKGTPWGSGSPTQALNEPTHSLVGNDIGASPTGLSLQQVSNLFPGLSQKQIQETMAGMGYTYQYAGGRGGMWVKTGEGTGTALPTSSQNLSSQGAPLDARGRPQWVDPTALERGERVTTQSGTTFVGGTPTASGQAQYAVTIPGGVDDERYKWAEKTRQDDAGNWVKVYSRVKRAQYTRQWRKKQQARAEEAAAAAAPVQQQAPVAQPQPSMTVQPPVGFNQLVNLRADYG